MYVCMQACRYVCMHVCMYVCMCVCVYVGMCVRVYVRMYVCMHGPVGELPGSLSGVIFVEVDADDMNVKERKGNAWTRKERNGK